MARLYAIALTVLALFGGTSIYVTTFIGLRSASVVALIGVLATIFTVALLSLEHTPEEEAPVERDHGDRDEVGLGLRHAHQHR